MMLLLALLTAVLAPAAHADEAPSRAELTRVFEKFVPRVVRIRAWDKASPMRTSSGTGFYASPDGLIVTAKHVVKIALQASGTGVIELRGFRDGERKSHRLPAPRVLGCGKSSGNDVCVLKIEGYPKAWFRIAPLAPKASTRVFSMGLSPGYMAIRTGLVTDSANHFGRSEILTSLDIAPGDSGGPVFTGQGELVGMNYVMYSYSDKRVPASVRADRKESSALSVVEIDQLISQLFEKKSGTRSIAEYGADAGSTLEW